MIPVTVSMGVAASDKTKRRGMNTLVRAADSALYRAKENGRNRVEFALDDDKYKQLPWQIIRDYPLPPSPPITVSIAATINCDILKSYILGINLVFALFVYY
jgi:hypothetical protein